MHKRMIPAILLTVLLLLLCTACVDLNADKPGSEATQEEDASADETSDVQATEAPAQDQDSAADDAAANSGYEVGDALPDFSVPLVDGTDFTLSEHLGKPVFINLFATWCPPCVAEMPEINRLYQEYGDEVVFIAIDIGEDKETAVNFADNNSYVLPFGYSLDGAPFADYNIEYIPQTFVLNADGTIVEFFAGGADYESFLAAIEKAQP